MNKQNILILVEREKNLVAKRAAKGFDNTWRLERLAHLEACLNNDHEFSEVIAVSASCKSSAAQVRCLWCDSLKT